MDREPSGPRLRYQFLSSYSSYYLSALFRPPTNVCPEGLPAHAPYLSTLPTVVSPQRVIFSPGRHLSPSHHTEAHLSLHHNPLPPCLPHPHHAYLIPNAVPLKPHKSILTSHSDASEPPFSATTAHGVSPLHSIPYPCRKPQVLASTPPPTPLLPDAYQCTSSVSEFPLP